MRGVPCLHRHTFLCPLFLCLSRDRISQAHPNWSSEQIHQATVANAKANPYDDLPNAGLAKFGNLLENQDCQDTSNPLCIDNRVWWTAMQKAYDYRKKK